MGLLTQYPFRVLDWRSNNNIEWMQNNVAQLYNRVRQELGLRRNYRIEWVNLGDQPGRIDAPNGIIQLNQLRLVQATAATRHYILGVLIHEMRHAYQFEAVNSPGLFPHVSLATRTAWARRFHSDWPGAQPPYYTMVLRDYFWQSVEWDAHAPGLRGHRR